MALPLERFRVIEFGTAWAGPMATQILADMGADVIKVESRVYMDGLRLGRPIVGDDIAGGDEGRWPDLQPTFHALNRNKRSLTVNLKHPRGREIIKDLVRVSDVVLTNFAPGVMEKLGLGYEELSAVNPRLIMAEMSAAGRSGPLRDLVGYAPSVHAMSGLSSVLGYEGEPPLGTVQVPYADAASALATATAVIAALWMREKTGHGQFIEVSEIEAVMALLPEVLLLPSMTGRDAEPRGNRHPLMAPHGNYPTADEDGWISIAVDSEEEWQELARAAGHEEWLADARFASREARLRNAKELDEELSRWTKTLSTDEIVALLAARNIAVFPVRHIGEVYFDPHHQERGVFPTTDHPLVGFEPIPGLAWRLHATPGSIRRVAPCLGEHTVEILQDLLGLDRAEIERLAQEGAVDLPSERS